MTSNKCISMDLNSLNQDQYLAGTFFLSYAFNTDFKVTSSGCHSVKVLGSIYDYSLVPMVTDLFRHLTYDSREAWHTLYAMLLSNYK